MSEKKNRDRTKARAWMVRKHIRQIEISKALGHNTVTQVNETLHNRRNDRRVLRYLLDIGCPSIYLELPDDMQKDPR